MEVKLFNGTPHGVEQQINDWMKEQNNLKVSTISLTVSHAEIWSVGPKMPIIVVLIVYDNK